MEKSTCFFLIDILILQVIVTGPFDSFFPEHDTLAATQAALLGDPHMLALMMAIVGIIGLLSMSYFVAMEFLIGQTVGKMVLSIGVYSPDRSVWRFIVRNIFVFFLYTLSIVAIIDFLGLFKGRRITEDLSKTEVVMYPYEGRKKVK